MFFAGESLVFKVLQDNNGKAPGRTGDMGGGAAEPQIFLFLQGEKEANI